MVPDDVREALVEAVQEGLGWPPRQRLIAEQSVDALLAHLEQVGWWGAFDPAFRPRLWEQTSKNAVGEPVYRIRKS